jgi:RNA-directed DNA polymerase
MYSYLENDELGLTHCCGTDLQGRFQVVRLTANKRMRATVTAIREKLYQRRHEPVPNRWCVASAGPNGYFAYHAVPTNMLRLDGFPDEVCRAWRQALLRRSQRHRLNWSRLNRLARKYVPSCPVFHPYPEERFFASRP